MGFRVTLAGDDLGVFDEKKFTVSDGILVKNATGGQTGLTIKGFLKGVEEMDPQALQALVWFLKFKRGEQVHISTIDYALGDLEVEEEPDPTPARTGSDAVATSVPSPN